MKTPINVKIPAQTADNQTTDARTAKPPMEFTVTKAGGSNTLAIKDRQAVQNRNPTDSYRVYFLPAAFAPTFVGTTATVPNPVISNPAVRQAGRKVASLVATVLAPGLGTTLSVPDTVNFGQKGYYYCVAVNRSGVEAPPVHIVGAP